MVPLPNQSALVVLLECGVSQVSPNRYLVQLDFIVKLIHSQNHVRLLLTEMKSVHVTKVTVHHVTPDFTVRIWE